jgi:outer membrane lipoprotein-sorting protein
VRLARLARLAGLVLLLAAGAAHATTTPSTTAAGSSYDLPLLAAPTAPITVPMVVERFEALDASLKSLTCDFRQYVRWDESGTTQEVNGTLEYQKPDKLHLEHKLPEPQTIVSDGVLLWIWRRSTNQVIETRLAEWKKSEPMAQGLLDFGRYADMLKKYDVSVSSVSDAPEAGAGQKRFALVLRPKDKSQDFSLRMNMTTRDFFPMDTELRVGSVSVHSVFSKIRYNPAIAAARFEFKPPPDADVFQNFKPHSD